MKLLFSRNPNPRLAVAVARHLAVDVAFEFAAPFAPGQADLYRHLNPSLRIPILVSDGRGLFEADAIACRLSALAGSDFWRRGDGEPEMIQWLSWGKGNFVHACDLVHFERGTRRRYHGHTPTDEASLARGLELFAESAALLDGVLGDRRWLLGDEVSYADFRMATFLPYNDAARLPVADHPQIVRWYRQLDALDAWRDPSAGLEAPALPGIPSDPP